MGLSQATGHACGTALKGQGCAAHHLKQLLWDGVSVHPGPHPIQGYGVIGQEHVLLKQPIACDLNPVTVTRVWCVV